MKSTELLRILDRLGATILTKRGRGSHVVVRLNGKQTTVPHGDLAIGTFRAILKQLDLKPEDLLDK